MALRQALKWLRAFDLESAQEAAGIVIERLSVMCGTLVVPDDEITDFPLLRPSKFFPRKVRPQLVK